MDQIEARIANRQEEMPEIASMVERFGSEHGISHAAIHDLSVALEEVLSNIIAYGFDEGAQSEILIRLTYRPGRILADVEDSGAPFDPLQFPPPDLTAPLEQRKIGGLGIHFVRSLMDEVVYSRVDGKNRLQLTKLVPTA